MKNFLTLGNWNILCDVCGQKYKASETKKRWDGLIVCPKDYELRHPSDFLRVQPEKLSVPFSRPYPDVDTFVPGSLPQTCTIQGVLNLADFGSADCMVVKE